MGTKQFDNYADLITFTRASGATLLDSDGLLKRAGHNLLTYSEQFDNAAWTFGAGGTLTADYATAPDGTNTAYRMEFPAAASTFISTNVSYVSGQAYTFSLWVKATSGTSQFDVNETSSGSGNFLGTQTATSDWQRFTFTFTASATTIAALGINNGNDSYASDILVWGAHLYRSDMPMVPNRNSGWTAETTYYPTTSAAYEAPRIEYDADGNRLGLLVEEQRTNLIERSEEFDNGYWAKVNTSITANTIVAPDGTLTGDKLFEDTSSSSSHHLQKNLNFTAGVSYTTTVYAKRGERQYLFLRYLSGGAFSTNYIAVFDLQNGVATNSSTFPADSFSITSVGNGWYRCSITRAADSTATGSVGFYLSNVGTGTTYTGDGASGVYIWGAQLETGAFPTSYIPTSGSTATRAADSASIPTSAFGYNASEGTLFVEASVLSDQNADDRRILEISDGTTSNFFSFYQDVSAGENIFIANQSGGSLTANFNTGFTITEGSTFKAVATLKDNDVAASVNGGSITSDTSTAISSALSEVNIGYLGGGTQHLNGHIKSIKYYPRRLTNAQLQELTQ
jgi:hypothetical protein